MSVSSVRIVAFGGSSVRIESAGRHASRVVEFLFRDMRGKGGPSPHATFRVQTGARGLVTVDDGRRVCYRGTSTAEAARSLLEVTSLSLAERSRDGLLFHAAAVCSTGGVLLLPGRAGVGKTTLAAWLVARGCLYLSDELVYLPGRPAPIQGFARPLNIKRSGRGTVGRLPGFGRRASESLTSSVARLIRAPRRATDRTRRSLLAIVFARFQPSAPVRTERLSPGASALRLMENLLNARNLPGHGFSSVADLARRVPAFEIVYPGFEEIEVWFDALMAGGGARVGGRRS